MVKNKEMKEYRLSELLEIKYGKDHKALLNGEIPCYGTGGLMRHVDKFLYDKESILIPRKGSLQNLYFVNKPFWTVDTLFWSKINKDLVKAKFLFYKLKTLNFSILNEGSAIPSLTTKTLNQIIVSIPNLETQEKIASILSALDDKIEINNEMNKTLEEMAQTLFKRWFIDFDFPNENGEPYKSSGGKMVDSELGEIPEGWEIKELEDLLELIIDYRGKTPKKLGGDWSNSGVKAISAKNIKNLELIDIENMNMCNNQMYNKWMKDKLIEGDILMTSEAPLGELYYFAEKKEYILSQRIYGIRADKIKILPSV